ncbi:MAG: hypothetical protein KAW39_04620 [Thermoplasmata archaeon]|nr:hypothetical protein [Thermoplasmata archaeon]
MTDALSMGQGIIEGGGRFQPFTYGQIPFPDYSLLVRYDGHAKTQTTHLVCLLDQLERESYTGP